MKAEVTLHSRQVDVARVLANLAGALAGRSVLAVIAVTLKVLLETAVILGDVSRGAGLNKKHTRF